jgi:hypothetical protein
VKYDVHDHISSWTLSSLHVSQATINLRIKEFDLWKDDFRIIIWKSMGFVPMKVLLISHQVFSKEHQIK